MGIIIRPSLLAFPISVFLLIISFFTICSAPNLSTQLMLGLLTVLPIVLALLIATRGRKYYIKDGYVHFKLFLQYPFSVAIDSLLGVAIKPVGIRSGHLQLQRQGLYGFNNELLIRNIAFPARATNFINCSNTSCESANKTSNNFLTNWFEKRGNTAKPTIRAYPYSLTGVLLFLWIISGADDIKIYLVLCIIFGLPVLIFLSISYFGNRYELKDGVVTAYHLLKRNREIRLDEIESLDLEPIGIMAGHITLKGSSGVVIHMKNIPLRLSAN